EAIQHVKGSQYDLEVKKSVLQISSQHAHDGPRQVRVDITGNYARRLAQISPAQFFSATSRMVMSPTPLATFKNCHHESQMSAVAGLDPVDIYGSFCGGAAFLKEMMYRHAREIDEVGISNFQGHGPFVIVGIILIAI